MIQNSLDSFNNCINPGGNFIPTGRIVQVLENDLAVGTTTLYTVPAGKKAALVSGSHYNANASSLQFYYTGSISGTDVKLGNSTNVSAGASSVSVGNMLILEAGEVLKIVVSTNGNLNIAAKIIEFDADVPIKTASVYEPSSGENTLYTCPTGKIAAFLNSSLTDFIGPSGAVYNLHNASGTTIVSYFHIVPSGGTAGTTTRLTTNRSAVDGNVSGESGNGFLNAGDFVSVNLNNTGTNSMLWVNVIELNA